MTESTSRVIIERIEPRTWAMRVRDARTDQVHELELRGGGPWKIDLDSKVAVADEGGKPRPQVAAPPDDAITLRVERDDRPGIVRVGAVGRGAKAWAGVQGTLLGSRWSHDEMGAPVVLLADRPTLLEEIGAALPEVTIDPSKYLAGTTADKPEHDVQLHAERSSDGAFVHITASGPNALDWVKQHPTLLGKRWRIKDSGPQMMVKFTEDLLAQVERETGMSISVSNWDQSAASTAPATTAPPVDSKDRRGTRSKSDRAPARERDEAARSEPEPTPETKPSRRKKPRPEPGPGPGGLTWEPVNEGGSEGLAARWGEGHFKLLHVGGDKYGLFYEHDGGSFETLGCGSLDEGKHAAGERIAGTRAAAPLDTRAAQLACAPGRKVGIPANDEITLHVRRSAEDGAAVIIHATGDRVHEWVFAHQTLMGRAWGRRDDNIPEVTIHDSPTLITDLRKEFPGVNLDTSDFKKLRRTAKPETEREEPAAEAAPAPAASEPAETETPAPQPSPAEPDAEANQDAELLRSIKGQLADMLDEED